MNTDHKPYLLLAIISVTRPYLTARVEGCNLPTVGTVAAFGNATLISTRIRAKLVMLYVSAQIVFALCEQLEDLEMRSGGTKSLALLTFSRLVFFEVQTFVELNIRPAETIISFSMPSWFTRRRIGKHQQCVYAVKELLEVTIRAKLAHCGTPSFSGNPRSMETSSVPGISSLQGSSQDISEELRGQFDTVRNYFHVTQIITIGNGNVSGNAFNG